MKNIVKILACGGLAAVGGITLGLGLHSMPKKKTAPTKKDATYLKDDGTTMSRDDVMDMQYRYIIERGDNEFIKIVSRYLEREFGIDCGRWIMQLYATEPTGRCCKVDLGSEVYVGVVRMALLINGIEIEGGLYSYDKVIRAIMRKFPIIKEIVPLSRIRNDTAVILATDYSSQNGCSKMFLVDKLDKKLRERFKHDRNIRKFAMLYKTYIDKNDSKSVTDVIALCTAYPNYEEIKFLGDACEEFDLRGILIQIGEWHRYLPTTYLKGRALKKALKNNRTSTEV